MKTKKEGISLIVLVITIIVMIVLAAAVVIFLSSTNVIDAANEATDKTSQAAIDTEQKVKELQSVLIEKWSGNIASDTEGFKNGPVTNAGLGTESNPYVIENGEQLAYFAKQVNSGNTFEGKYIVITKSINLGNKPFASIGIGNVGLRAESAWLAKEGYTPFKGSLDGQNNVITGININLPLVHGVALVGVLEEGGTVKNIDIYESNIVGKTCVAGVVGASRGTIINCRNNASVTAQDNEDPNSGQMSGGIVGFVAKGTVDKCLNNGYVIARTDSGSAGRGKYSGGIVGYACGPEITISNCINNGKIECMHQQVGGILGANEYNTYNITIKNCSNNGDVIANFTNTISYSGSIAGGVIGWMYGPGVIDNCINNGNVETKQWGVGGIAGQVSEGTIQNCKNKGQVKSGTASSGGIAGTNYSIINNCINSGMITATNGKRWRYKWI